MKITVNTPTRRTSITGYTSFINARNEREAKKLAEQEANKEGARKELIAASQSKINTLCTDIESKYRSMVKDGIDMQRCQDELRDKLKEEELYHATVGDLYVYEEVDKSLENKMGLRRFAYYALPALDCFFAYFALYPIVTSKIADLSSVLADFAIVIGAVLSIAVGLGISLISRLGVASLEKGDTDSMRILKIVGIAGAVISLPLMYIVGEIAFNGGTQWTYSGCFAFISLIIQLLIVSGYKRQLEALEYFRMKKSGGAVEDVKESDEKAISKEVAAIRERIQSILSSFEQHFAQFTEKFRSLAAARDEHVLRFGEEAHYYLNQMVIYFGDLVCFRREAIPLYYEANGAVSTIPLVDFPHVAGGRDLFANNDFVYLDYMMQRTQTGIPLSETFRAMGDSQPQELPPPSGQAEPEEGAGTPVETPVETPIEILPPPDVDADENPGDGVIWE